MDTKIIIIIAVICLCLVSVSIAVFFMMKPSGPRYTLVERMDYPGNDITNLNDSTIGQCTTKCNETNGCVGFNFNAGTKEGAKGTCWIKNGTPNPTTTNDWNWYKKN